ncbi:MAG: hypothetical protein D6773_08255, partial [Alphaproteobacteria bacterium]
MKSSLAILAGAVALLSAAALPAPADAAIKCQGPNQVNPYGLIRTPYCEDNYLAYVAKHYHGMYVSAKAIRHNPNYKEEICRVIGHDIRVNDICIGFRP